MKKHFEVEVIEGKKRIIEGEDQEHRKQDDLHKKIAEKEKELFFSLAVAIKLHLSGQEEMDCNTFNIAALYDKAIKTKVPSESWQKWIPQQFNEQYKRSLTIQSAKDFSRITSKKIPSASAAIIASQSITVTSIPISPAEKSKKKPRLERTTSFSIPSSISSKRKRPSATQSQEI